MDSTVEIPVLVRSVPREPLRTERATQWLYEPAPAATTWDGHAPGTVLLAVADPRVREELRLTMRGRGYAVLEASCGWEVVNLCQRHVGPIDALVADAGTQPVDGRALADRVGELRPATAVLHLCGRGDTLPRGDGRKLRSPFGLKEFLAAVAEVVDR